MARWTPSASAILLRLAAGLVQHHDRVQPRLALQAHATALAIRAPFIAILSFLVPRDAQPLDAKQRKIGQLQGGGADGHSRCHHGRQELGGSPCDPQSLTASRALPTSSELTI